MALEILVIGLLTLCILIIFSARKDLTTLHKGLESLLRGQPCPTRMAFKSPLADSLWQKMKNGFFAQRQGRVDGPKLYEILEATEDIVQESDREHQVADTTCDIILQQATPEAKAVAILLQDGLGEFRLLAARGCPAKRIELPLVAHLEQLRDEEETKSRSMLKRVHVISQQSSQLNFAVLGIGSSSFSLIRQDGKVTGAIWIGFQEMIGSLSQEKLLFLQSLAQHFAASFSVAKRVQERLDESSRERQWLLGMSHDLRSPGNSALYSLRDIISEDAGPLNREQRIRLEIIESCIRDQLDIVGDIFDLTKHRQGMLSNKPTTFAPNKSFASIFETFRREANQKGLSFIMRQTPDLYCLADERQIKRVLVNLLSNALKYTDHGETGVEITRSQKSILIRVWDTGIGIPHTEREKLFKEYSRLENAGSRQGIGLGLLVAKTLVEINGGNLTFRDKTGGGAIFEFTLPLVEPTTTLQALPTVDTGKFKRFHHVLVVEDDPAAQRTHAKYLSEYSHSIATATSCREAIAAIRKQKPELVVTDLFLENETSEALLAFLKDTEQKPRIILTTGSGDTALLESLRLDYALQVLEKPCDRGSFQRVLLQTN